MEDNISYKNICKKGIPTSFFLPFFLYMVVPSVSHLTTLCRGFLKLNQFFTHSFIAESLIFFRGIRSLSKTVYNKLSIVMKDCNNFNGFTATPMMRSSGHAQCGLVAHVKSCNESTKEITDSSCKPFNWM